MLLGVAMHTNGTILPSGQGIRVVHCQHRLEGIYPCPEDMGCLLEHLGQWFPKQVMQTGWNRGPLVKQLLYLSSNLGFLRSSLGGLDFSMSVFIP